jgi:hypothetical protein
MPRQKHRIENGQAILARRGDVAVMIPAWASIPKPSCSPPTAAPVKIISEDAPLFREIIA